MKISYLLNKAMVAFPLLKRNFFAKIWRRFINRMNKKGELMKIKEIMTQKVISISPETNAREALELLVKMQISGLPVIDENNKLVGMFTEKEILAAVLPSYIEKVGSFVYQDNPKAVKQKIAAFQTTKVKEVMRQEVITIDEETSLSEAARLMLTKKARRLPVLNKTKEVVGIVSRGDLMKALFTEVEKQHEG